MSEQVLSTTDAAFESDVLQATEVVLVDFWAPWCQPCKMIMPILDEVAKEYQGKLRVCKVNVDENTEIAAKFNVRGIPCLLLFKEGNLMNTKVGVLTKSQLVSFIEEHIDA